MNRYSFRVIVLEPVGEDLTVALFEAGCDDAIVGLLQGTPTVHFCRKAVSLERALKTACRTLRAVNLTVDRIVIDTCDLSKLPGGNTVDSDQSGNIAP